MCSWDCRPYGSRDFTAPAWLFPRFRYKRSIWSLENVIPHFVSVLRPPYRLKGDFVFAFCPLLELICVKECRQTRAGR